MCCTKFVANLLLLLCLTLACGDCSDASGTLQGGGLLPLGTLSSGATSSGSAASGGSGASGSSGSSGAAASGAASSGTGDAGSPATFTLLYQKYFGNPLQGGCGAGTCHQVAADMGATFSGFICGNTQASCYAGMMKSVNAKPAIVPMGGAPNAMTTLLWTSLYSKFPPGMLAAATNNMPYTLTYMYTPQDMALIGSWIQAGAPNN